MRQSSETKKGTLSLLSLKKYFLLFLEIAISKLSPINPKLFVRDEGVTKAAIAALGDLADTLGTNVKTLFEERTFHKDFIGECFATDDEMLKETATWAQGMLNRVLVS